MIQNLPKRYQISLWATIDRSGPALSLEFDSQDEALAELERQRESGVYRSGLCLEWRKVSEEWALVEHFPK
jgi:hypothetical protein